MTDTTTQAPQIFDAHSESFDAARRRLIPPFERFYGTAVEALRLGDAPPQRILDLGAGTARVSRINCAGCGRPPSSKPTVCSRNTALPSSSRSRDWYTTVTVEEGQRGDAGLADPPTGPPAPKDDIS
jgi:tRNA (cmo5U34)-methyltransferase